MALLRGVLFGLLAAPFGVLSQIQLVPSAPAAVKPGESLTMTCKVSGDSIATRGWWNWVRELPGRGLQWVGRIHFSGSTNYAPDLQTRANIAKDDAKNEYYLELRSLTAADTATYYCTSFSVLAQIQLVQSGPGAVKPGETLTMTCTVSGQTQ
ncbi:unnamed protein product [Natator depressus]